MPPYRIMLAGLLLSVMMQSAHAQTYKTLVKSDFGSTATPNTISTAPATAILPGTTDYTPITNILTAPNDGKYVVTNYSYAFNGTYLWIPGAPDHTTDAAGQNGYMMLINANPSLQGETNGSYYLYTTAAFDVPGATYNMDFWAANLLLSTSTYKNAYIGLSVRDAIGTGTLYANNSWVLPKTANNTALPWQNKNVSFTLPLTYSGNTLYFNFYNSDVNSSTAGNDLVLDDITIKMQVVTLSGKVFNDLNGNGVQDVNELGINGATTPLFAYITDANNKIVSKVQVGTDGTYTLSTTDGVPYATSDIGLKVIISSQNLSYGTVLTGSAITGYTTVGENAGNNAAITTGAIDGVMKITNSAIDIPNVNFGIKQPPQSYDLQKNVAGAPSPGTVVQLGDTPLQGTDPGNVNTQTGWTGKSLNITSVPTNGFDLYYDGHLITAADVAATGGYTIPNYDPSKLSMTATNSVPGSVVTTSFQYAVTNGLGLTDLTPATFTITFSNALPVTFGRISATYSNGVLTVDWETVMEKNNDHFIIEASADGVNFKEIGTIGTLAPGGNADTPVYYTFTRNFQNGIAIGGLAILGLLGMCTAHSKRNKRQLLGSCITSVFIFAILFTACKKNTDATTYDAKNVYIRIVQVDKDGKKTPAKVVKATSAD